MNKGVAITGAGALICLGAYVIYQKNRLTRLISNLHPKINNVKHFNISKGNIKFDLNLRFYNPSDEDLNLTSGFIKLKELVVRDKQTDKILARTNLNLNKLEIKSKTSLSIPTISVSLPILETASLVIQQITQDNTEFTDRLKYDLKISYFGIDNNINF